MYEYIHEAKKEWHAPSNQSDPPLRIFQKRQGEFVRFNLDITGLSRSSDAEEEPMIIQMSSRFGL